MLLHILQPSSVCLRTLWKVGWFTKIIRVEISMLPLIPLKERFSDKEERSLRLAHLVKRIPWLWADFFFQQELCWLKKLLPTSCSQLLATLPLARATGRLRCICASGSVKRNPASWSGSNRKSLITGLIWAETG